ncbi:MAG: glutaminase A [Oligoflexia bacterium]|nr:glutaminase A [Oligoflexia bacterium]
MRSTQVQQLLEELHAKYADLRDGKVADYIPELSKADPDAFGVVIATVEGEIHEVGVSRAEFTLQSMSKPFVYGLALEDRGREFLLSRVGVEPTGEAFNSIIELEEKTHRPYNPMVNSGAIAVASMIRGEGMSARISRILDMFRRYTGRPVGVNAAVFASERETAHRNRAIAHLMRHFNVIGPEIDLALDLYFQQCSVSVTCHDLALMAATLAKGGVHPLTGERALRADLVRDVLTLMFTCGMYDSAGDWAYSVGIPGKSGVSGGIFGVVPGRMGIAVYSPLLDPHGHSIRGEAVFRELSTRLGLSVFHAGAH